MTAKDAISHQIVPLSSRMLLDEGLRRMKMTDSTVLPVVDDGVYKGVVTEHSLHSGGVYVGDVVSSLNPVSSSTALSGFLDCLSQDIPLLPVVDEAYDRYVGAIDRNDAVKMLMQLFPPLDEFTELTVTCKPGQYSASIIAHAVEAADAHLLNLNVVGGTTANSETTVVIRVNHSRGDSVARSLMRYGYETVEMGGKTGAPSSELAEKVNELLRYIEV